LRNVPRIPDRRELFERFPALATDLNAKDADALLAALVEREVAPEVELLSEGEDSSALFFILEGDLKLFVGERGKRSEVGRLGPGAVLGEVSFLDGEPTTATVTAASPIHLLALERPAFEALAAREPRAAAALLRGLCRVLAAHVREATQQVDRMNAADGPPAKAGGWIETLKSLFGIGSS
jgi:CRP-like cAMP-binding protein